MSNAPPKRSLPAWSEKPSADLNWSPTDDALAQYPSEAGQSETTPTRSDVEDPTLSGIEDSATSGIAVAQSETALDGTSARGLAAEIAHLQALIEGLTNFMGNEPRSKFD